MMYWTAEDMDVMSNTANFYMDWMDHYLCWVRFRSREIYQLADIHHGTWHAVKRDGTQ